MDYETRLRVLGLVSLEERRRIKDLVSCYKYINGFTDVDVHYFTPGLCLRTRSSHNQKLQIQFCRTVLSSLFLIELCLHGIAFLILLFLLRILLCLENVCLCITVQVINKSVLLCLFLWYVLTIVFFVFCYFISGMSLHRSGTSCSYSFHHLMNKSFNSKNPKLY